MPDSNTSPAQALVEIVGYFHRLDTDRAAFRDWAGGVINGGPDGDGRYPLTDFTNNVHMTLCPAQIIYNLDTDEDGFVTTDEATGIATTVANAKVAVETSARTTADNALSSRITTVEANYVTTSAATGIATSVANAAVATEATARANGDAAEATARTNIVATLRSETTAAVAGEATARTTAITAAITSEAGTRASADSAMATRLDAIEADYETSGEVNTKIATEVTNRNSAISTAIAGEASARTAIVATLRSETTAAVAGEATARGTAITAAVGSEASARVSGDNAASSRLDTIEASYVTTGAMASAISASASSLTTAYAAADAVVAGTVTSLTTVVGGHTSTLATYGTSIGGLQAKYGVKIDVNGRVSGFETNAGGGTSDFIVTADKFAIVEPGSGKTPFVPFEVSSGVVRIKTAVIQELSVGKLTSGTLGVDVDLDGDINVGTGRLVFDNGTFMRVQGTGFGTSSQFIDWFGPSMAISACSEAGAITYMKTNGDAYFGGNLAAGILRNSVQATAVSGSAEALIGPFLTNGDPKSVVVSFEYREVFKAFSGSVSGGAATIEIEKSTNGTSWTSMSTLVASVDNYLGVDGDPSIRDNVRGRLYGSTSFTDTTGATATLYYRARFTTWTPPSTGGTSAIDYSLTQFISLISTES